MTDIVCSFRIGLEDSFDTDSLPAGSSSALEDAIEDAIFEWLNKYPHIPVSLVKFDEFYVEIS